MKTDLTHIKRKGDVIKELQRDIAEIESQIKVGKTHAFWDFDLCAMTIFFVSF